MILPLYAIRAAVLSLQVILDPARSKQRLVRRSLRASPPPRAEKTAAPFSELGVKSQRTLSRYPGVRDCADSKQEKVGEQHHGSHPLHTLWRPSQTGPTRALALMAAAQLCKRHSKLRSLCPKMKVSATLPKSTSQRGRVDSRPTAPSPMRRRNFGRRSTRTV